MIDFAKIEVGTIVEVVGMGAPGFAEIGDILKITQVEPNKVFAFRSDGKEVFFAITCGASRLSLVEEAIDG